MIPQIVSLSLPSPQNSKGACKVVMDVALLQSMRPAWRIRSQEKHQAISRECWWCCCRSVSCCVVTLTSRCTYHFLLAKLGSGWAQCQAELALEPSHFLWHAGSALGSLLSHFHIAEAKNFCDAMGVAGAAVRGFEGKMGTRHLFYGHMQGERKN